MKTSDSSSSQSRDPLNIKIKNHENKNYSTRLNEQKIQFQGSTKTLDRFYNIENMDIEMDNIIANLNFLDTYTNILDISSKQDHL